MSNELINLESDYEYVIGSAIGNVLNLQAQFSSMDWAREELYIIAKELEQTGKLFAEKQGLGMSTPVESINGKKFSIVNYHKTGNLINSIHAKVNKNGINFFNNARNPRGQFYAGHIEYGFHDRGGKPVPARPFMRPAFYAVAEASRGKLQGALGRFISSNPLFTYHAVGGAVFGHMYTDAGNLRAFYNQQVTGRGANRNTGYYTSRGLLNSKMNSQTYWTNNNKYGISVNRVNSAAGTVRRGNKPSSFVGKGNSGRFNEGTKVTSSTRRFANYGKTKKVPLSKPTLTKNWNRKGGAVRSVRQGPSRQRPTSKGTTVQTRTNRIKTGSKTIPKRGKATYAERKARAEARRARENAARTRTHSKPKAGKKSKGKEKAPLIPSKTHYIYVQDNNKGTYPTYTRVSVMSSEIGTRYVPNGKAQAGGSYRVVYKRVD